MNKLRHVRRYTARCSAVVQVYLMRALLTPLFLLPAILLVPGASAQDAVQRVTLERAMEMFSRNNYELRIARTGVKKMSGLARQAAAYPNPRVAVTHEPLFEGGDRQAESYFNLSQRIEWPSLRLARTEAGNRLAQAAVHQVRVDSLRLAFEVAHVYIEAVAAEARTETLQSVAKIFREAERVVVAREGEGDASGYDIRRLRVERARYETALAIANLNQHAIWRHLAILILPEGEGDEVGPAAPPSIPLSRLGLEEAILAARLHRPEIAFTKEKVEAARALVAQEYASRLPSPTLVAGYKRQSNGFSGPLFGVALPVPIFNRNRGMIEARQAELHAAETQLMLVERQIENDVIQAYETHDSLVASVELIRDGLLADVGGLLRSARVSYDEGEMLLVELLDATEAYQDARIMSIDLLADLQTSHYDLLRAIGGGPPSP